MDFKSIAIQEAPLPLHKISNETKDEILNLVEIHESDVTSSGRLNLFSSVGLPNKYSHIVRDISCKIVIPVKHASWKRLKAKLSSGRGRWNDGQGRRKRGDYCLRSSKFGETEVEALPDEIFAVNWPESYKPNPTPAKIITKPRPIKRMRMETRQSSCSSGGNSFVNEYECEHPTSDGAANDKDNDEDSSGSDSEMDTACIRDNKDTQDDNENGYIANVSDLLNSRDEEELQNRLVGLFTFSGTLEGGRNFILVELDAKRKTSRQFKMFCEMAKNYTIHWLQACPLGFMWRKTHGSTMLTIRSKFTQMSWNEVKWLQHINQEGDKEKYSRCLFASNIICISGVAGTGKSLLLSHTAREIKVKYKERVVCFVNLKKMNEKMEMMDLVQNIKAINFSLFLQLLFIYFEIKSDLERALLTSLLSSKWGNVKSPKVEIFLDGLDEMNSKMRRILLNFFKDEMGAPEEWSFRVWITTRPHLKTLLEDKFSVLAYDLANLELSDITDNDEVEAFKNDMASPMLKHHLKVDLKEVLALPYRTYAFQTYVKRNKVTDLFSLSGVDILYEILESMKENHVEKQIISSSNIRNKKEVELLNIKSIFQRNADELSFKHAIVAVYTFLQKIQKKNHLNRHFNYNVEELKTLFDERELLSFGLVRKSVDNEGIDDVDNNKINCDEKADEDEEQNINLKFENDMFAAYILADYYTTHMPGTKFLTDFFLNCVLFWDECNEIRQFYLQKMHKGINIEVANAWCEEMQNFLILTYNLSDGDTFEHDRVHHTANLLQLAIIDQKLGFAKFILKSFQPRYHLELKRLIERKVKVEIDSLQPKQKLIHSLPINTEEEEMEGAEDDDEEEEREDNGNNHHIGSFIEVSSISLAIMFGDEELLHLMYFVLGGGIEVDEHIERVSYQDTHKFSPLHLAVLASNPDTLNYLSRHRKLSTNKLDANGHLPIHLTFYNKWCLKFNLGEPKGHSMKEIIMRKVKILKYYNDLTGRGTITVTTDRAGRYPILASRLEEEVHLSEDVNLLQDKMENNLSFTFQPTDQEIIYYKSSFDYVQIIEKLTGRTFVNMQSKVSPKMRIEPPFHLACAEGSLPMVKCMLKKGAEINIRDKNHCTALFASLKKGHVHVVKFLLNNGIEKGDLYKFIGDSPLIHYVATLNHSDMLEFLISELKTPVDLLTNYDRTPLHIACSIENGRCLKSAKVLCKLGANVNARDTELLTPIMYACRLNKPAAVAVGGNGGGNPAASKSGVCKLIKLLLDNDASVNAQSDTGETALHYAVKNKNLEVVKQLITYPGLGAAKNAIINVNVKATGSGIKGQTPLHYACQEKRNLAILKCLVMEGGASVNAEDSLGRTPLGMLVDVADDNAVDEEMAEFLVERGASIFHKSKMGKVPVAELRIKNVLLATKLFNKTNEQISANIKSMIRRTDDAKSTTIAKYWEQVHKK